MPAKVPAISYTRQVLGDDMEHTRKSQKWGIHRHCPLPPSLPPSIPLSLPPLLPPSLSPSLSPPPILSHHQVLLFPPCLLFLFRSLSACRQNFNIQFSLENLTDLSVFHLLELACVEFMKMSNAHRKGIARKDKGMPRRVIYSCMMWSELFGLLADLQIRTYVHSSCLSEWKDSC